MPVKPNEPLQSFSCNHIFQMKLPFVTDRRKTAQIFPYRHQIETATKVRRVIMYIYTTSLGSSSSEISEASTFVAELGTVHTCTPIRNSVARYLKDL